MLIPKYQLQLDSQERCIQVSIEALSFDNENFLNFVFECLKEFGEFKLNGVLIQLKSAEIKDLNADEWLLINFPEVASYHLKSGWTLAVASANSIQEITLHTINEMNLG